MAAAPYMGWLALKPQTGSAVPGVVATASARITIPTDSEVFLLSLTTDAWVKLGGSAVDAVASTAGNTLLLAGTYTFNWPSPATNTHLAFIRNSADGAICITPLL